MLDPFEVTKIINETAILQRNQVANHYRGMPLDCVGQLHSIMELSGGNRVRLMMTMSRKETYSCVVIQAQIDPSRVPGITLLKTGDLIRLKGVIERASENGFDLKDAELLPAT